MIKPKKPTRHANNTDSGSMYTPALMFENQRGVLRQGYPLPNQTPGTNVNAKAASTAMTPITK